MLEVARLIGERFDAALVASAAARDEAATVDLLDEAARAGLIAEVDDEPDYWRFSHSLSRRVTAARLSRGRRARLHQRIGETLESRFGVSRPSSRTTSARPRASAPRTRRFDMNAWPRNRR